VLHKVCSTKLLQIEDNILTIYLRDYNRNILKCQKTKRKYVLRSYIFGYIEDCWHLGFLMHPQEHLLFYIYKE